MSLELQDAISRGVIATESNEFLGTWCVADSKRAR